MAWLDVEGFDCCTVFMCVLHQPSTNLSETFEMLKQAFGDSCMSRSRTFVWFWTFQEW